MRGDRQRNPGDSKTGHLFCADVKTCQTRESFCHLSPGDQPDDARRLVTLSRGGGETWPVVYRDDALVSTTVHAGLCVYDPPDPGAAELQARAGLVLFSNPANAIRMAATAASRISTPWNRRRRWRN